MRNFIKIVVFTITFGSNVSSESAIPPGTGNNLPPQGLFESCTMSDAECLNHLTTMGQAGFKLVLNYGSNNYFAHFSTCGGGNEQTTYADKAVQVGIKVIWDYEGCQYTDDATIQQSVNIVKNHEGTWGYCVGDEDLASDATAVQRVSNAIHEADPNHPRLMLHRNEASNLIPFVDAADFLMLTYYPIGDISGQQAATGTGNVAAELQALADQNGKQSGMILQAFSWADYLYEYSPSGSPRYPTRDEMRMMRDAVLANSKPSLILWYSYFDLAKTAPATFWDDFVWAALGHGRHLDNR